MTPLQNPISRRRFASSVVLGGVGFFLFGLEGCEYSPSTIAIYDPNQHSPLSKLQFHTLDALLQTLFPDDGNGPGCSKFGALEHVINTVNDKRLDPKENQLILDKLDAFHEHVSKKEETEFHLLSSTTKNQIVEDIIDTDWSKYWLSRLLTLTFEALLCDPLYNVNTQSCGWDWLQHSPGYPRPEKQNLYPQIFVTHEI